MRTVPGSEIVGSAELRRRVHKKKERKKERSKKREETGERKGGAACQLYACVTLSRQFSPIISKPGTGYLTIG